MVILIVFIVFLVACGAVPAQEEPPPSPFASQSIPREARHGTVEMSDGTVYEGEIYFTRDKMLRIFDRKHERYRDFRIAALAEINVAIEKEEIEREWRWKEGGNDTKVYTGRSYPWRKYVTTAVLVNGQQFTGDTTTLFYVKTDNDTKKFVFHRRDKGDYGTKLSDLLYVKRVRFGTGKKENKQE